jgi:hypothetical protein
MRGRRLFWRKAALACALLIPGGLACAPSDPGPEVDTDHDGLSDQEELEVYGTSPLDPDTDGDGYNDYDEVVTYGFDPTNDPDRFNPRVADVPQMTVLIMGPPLVTLITQLTNGQTVTYDNSISGTWTVGTANDVNRGATQSNTQSVSQTAEQDMSVSPMTMNQVSETVPLDLPGSTVVLVQGEDAGAPRDAGGGSDAGEGDAGEGGGAGTEADASLASDSGGGATDASEGALGGAEVSTSPSSGATVTVTQGSGTTLDFGNALSTTVNPSTTFETSINFDQSQMEQNSETVTQDQALALTHQVSATNASIKVTTVIANTGHVAFRLTNLELGTAFVEASGVRIPLENLELDQGLVTTFQPFSLGPGQQTGVVNFINVTELDTALLLLSTGRSFLLQLGLYELDDATGKPYVFDSTTIGAKTALVAIDYGQGKGNGAQNESGAPQRDPELYQVATNFDPSQPGATAAQLFQNILYVPYVANADTGLMQVRDVGMQASGADHWSVALSHDEGPDIVTTTYGDGDDPYDFDGIQVRAGDVLHLAYVAKGASADEGGIPSLQQGTGPPADASYQPATPSPEAGIP